MVSSFACVKSKLIFDPLGFESVDAQKIFPDSYCWNSCILPDHRSESEDVGNDLNRARKMTKENQA